MKRELIEKITEYSTIIIHRHMRPDGDALGSQLGLADSLKATFPDKKIYVVGETTPRLDFFGTMDIIDDSVYQDALCLILDVAVTSMVSDDRYRLAKEVYVIDHHTNPCNVPNAKAYIDSTSIACAEIVAELLLENDFVITPRAATMLYGGIVTDSGRFLYAATTARTFRIVAKLLDLGADIQFIYNNLYVDSLASKRLTNYFASRFEVSPNGVGYLINKENVFEELDVDFYTVSRGMISVMAGISEIVIWCNFTIDISTNLIGGEFRSRDIEIVDIAKKYGGGGHALACGATLSSWQQVEEVLKDFEELAKRSKCGN